MLDRPVAASFGGAHHRDAVAQRGASGWVLDLCLIGAIAWGSIAWSWVGFAGSDDAAYIGAAHTWLHGVPAPSGFFGDLRFPVIWPITGAIALFGDHESSVVLPTVGYALGCLAVTYLGVRLLAGRAAGLLAAVLLAASPLFSGLASTPGDDIPELFFNEISLFLFLYAARRQVGGGWRFYAAGIAAGLAFMTRESTVALLGLYSVLFLVGFGGRRGVYWIMAGGFATVFGAEMAGYTVWTGDPLYRVRLVLAAAQHPDPVLAKGLLDFSAGRVFHISPLIDPFPFALAHPEFGLIFLAGIGAAVWALRQGPPSPPRDIARVASLLAALGFLISAYVLGHLALLPRYFLVPAFCATVMVACWVVAGLWQGHRRLAVGVVAVLLVADLGGKMVMNTAPLFAERALVRLAAQMVQPVHTDPETAYRGTLLYGWAGDAGRVVATPPGPGDLFFFNPRFAGNRTPRTAGINWARYTPQPGWQVMRRVSVPGTALGRVLRWLGLAGEVPHVLAGKIGTALPPVVLFRVGGQ